MFAKIETAIEDIKNGKMLIVVDDENRENEGDLIFAAEKATPEMINFMITNGKGLVCVPMLERDLNRLRIPQMVSQNSDSYHTAFSISVDYHQTNTGISAYERSQTIQALINPTNTAKDFRMPGHVFPLCAKHGGVLEREGHTEAAVDLSKLAGLFPAGVICEIIKPDGSMARLSDLKKMSQKWDLNIVSIADLISYRKKNQTGLKLISKVDLPTKWGHFSMFAFDDFQSPEPHLALVKGSMQKEPVLTRIHSECLTGDLFGSNRCDCGEQLHRAMQEIEEEGNGLLLYLRQEGRGIGLSNKLKAYELQEKGIDTVDANIQLGFEPELRDFRIAAQILQYFNISSVKLMTNNPKKIQELEENNIKVSMREPIEIQPTCENKFYLKTKKERMGHVFHAVHFS